MQNNSFSKFILFVCVVVLFASCDKDFNEIGSDIIGEDHFGLLQDTTKTVTAYNQNLGPIQSNNLPVNALGIYNNPAFGVTKANFATQLELATVNPTIDAALHPEIESVVLTMPYYSTKTNTATDGTGTYVLDSIYGPANSKIKLSVYESGYFIRDLDPGAGFQEQQKYYTDQNADFDNTKGALLNNDPDASQNNAFVFSPAEYVVTTTTDGATTTTRTGPGMRLNLDKNFFKSKIINAPAGKLLSNNVFKDYFRGLYFKVDYSGSEAGNLAMLNIKQGKITIKYKEDKATTVAGVTTITRDDKTIVLNVNGNSVGLFEQSNINPNYSSALTGANTVAGDEKLYLKGGQGAMTVINLFGSQDVRGYDANGVLIVPNVPNGVSDELDDLRNPIDGQKWLVNEANLTFYIDKTAMTGGAEPNRIYLYDLNNNKPILDYYSDFSVSSDPKLIKLVHGGIIEKETTGDKRGIKYKIRLTNHIRNLIRNDSTNIKLGLVVTESISTTSFAKLKTSFSAGLHSVDRAPLSSVINPLGTVLFGNNIPFGDPNYKKRLKLEIYYTKPN